MLKVTKQINIQILKVTKQIDIQVLKVTKLINIHVASRINSKTKLLEFQKINKFLDSRHFQLYLSLHIYILTMIGRVISNKGVRVTLKKNLRCAVLAGLSNVTYILVLLIGVATRLSTLSALTKSKS